MSAIITLLLTFFTSAFFRELLAAWLKDFHARRADNLGLLAEAKRILTELETSPLDGTARYEQAFAELKAYAQSIILEGGEAANKTLWDFIGAKGLDDVIQLVLSKARGL